MVEYFGARLRELREQAGLSRKELAEKAGLQSEAGIRNLEQGIRSPSWETVIALADALGCSTEAFREKPAVEAEQPRRPGRPRKREVIGGRPPKSGDNQESKKPTPMGRRKKAD